MKVSIIIPTYNGLNHLKSLLPSIEEVDFPKRNIEVIIVDNNSVDNTKSYIKENYKDLCRIIHLRENAGFCKACNIGAKTAEGKWLVFLNNDMKLDKNFLKGFLEVIDGTDIVCGGAKILSWDGSKIDFVKGSINPLGFGFNDFYGKKYEEGTFNTSYPLLFPCGGAMIIRKDIFSEVKGFDEKYYMLFEDVDLGWRLNLFGYKVYFCPNAVCYHKGHATLSKKNIMERIFYHERNAFFNIFKNYEEDCFQKAIPYFLSYLGMKIHFNILYSNGKYTFKDKVKNYLVKFLYPRFKPFSLINENGYAFTRVYKDILKNMRELQKDRHYIQDKRKISDKELFSKFPFIREPWQYTNNYSLFLDYKKQKNIIEEICREITFV